MVSFVRLCVVICVVVPLSLSSAVDFLVNGGKQQFEW